MSIFLFLLPDKVSGVGGTDTYVHITAVVTNLLWFLNHSFPWSALKAEKTEKRVDVIYYCLISFIFIERIIVN